MRVASRVAKRHLRKLENIRKVPKLHRMIAQCPAPAPLKISKTLLILAKKLPKNSN